MSGKETNVWLQITSGQGPDECALAAFKLVQHIIRISRTANISIEIVDRIDGPRSGTYSSALLSVAGTHAEEFSENWIGTIQWICKSPYRQNSKRKNWFIGVDQIKFSSTKQSAIRCCDVTWKSTRASGPGGQHVNTTASAVQITHTPTGVQTSASAARSQHANKKLALEKLEAILVSRQQNIVEKQKRDHWHKHGELERGNPVKVFHEMDFKQR